jgi:hypothetical protein
MTIPLHLLPQQAQADFEKIKSSALSSNGVERHYSGHDGYGLGFRFFIFDRYNKLKSDETKSPANPSGVEIFDRVEMREVFVDKKTRLHEIVTDRIRAQYPEEYRRFKEGLDAPGLPLAKWGVIPSNEVATFAKAGIFTVEQLAAQNSDKIAAFPKQFFDYFTRAQQHVAAKSGNFEIEKQAEKLVDMQKAYAQLEQRLLSLEDEKRALLEATLAKQQSAVAATTGEKRGRGRPKKIILDEGAEHEIA